MRTAGDAPDSGVAASRVNRLPKRGESGFTLVEVLVAIVVLSITGLAAAQFAITAIRTSYAQQQRSTAVSLGDDGMERMRAQIANVDANQYLDELIKGMGKRPSPPRKESFRRWRHRVAIGGSELYQFA
ncbi:MAG: prepilin-type N-terminal cleavage/methylation domain-containing protein [Bifidobacterium sp.]